MDIEEDIRLINEVWGSEDNLHEFIDSELRRLGAIICGEAAKLPNFQVQPTEMASEIMGFSIGRSCAGRYEPDNGQCGTISLFAFTCTSESEVRTALAHELVHHWEVTNSSNTSDLPYPKEADTVIKSIFPDPNKEGRWRSGHSEAFVTKASVVAKVLGIPLEDFLVYRKRTTVK